MNYKLVNGTFDILPADSHKWQFIEAKIREFMSTYNYKEIRTPIFEYTELFKRSIGDQTDIVSKEMYTFPDSKNKSLTLRPENTASAMRAVIENNLVRENPQLKTFYIGPMFRRERPQKGRYRQFHQFGIEASGPKSAELDFEVILLAVRFYESFALKNVELEINSIGDLETRQIYIDALKKHLNPIINDYCENCRNRFNTNPLRVLDCKIDHEKNQNVPKITDFLNEDSKAHYERVLELLEFNNISFRENHLLVRGLDYYSDTVFEVTSSDLGAQSALCGGGRYDYLVEELGGKYTPSVGFAAGIERLLLSLEANDYAFEERYLDLFFVCMNEKTKLFASKISDSLRRSGFKVDMDFCNRSVKSQMKYANKINAKYVVVIGDDEINSNQITVKRMEDGEEFKTSFIELSNYLN